VPKTYNEKRQLFKQVVLGKLDISIQKVDPSTSHPVQILSQKQLTILMQDLKL
jgi:hypothetical protein